MIDLSTLNNNQREAVNWENGPMLVLAGPGSGKTRVLTYRIARLIECSRDKHFKILGLTFTNKAAAEMRERVANLVTNAIDRTLLTTFHSFAADLLRQHGNHIGLKPDFTILVQDSDRHALLDEAINRAQTATWGPGVTSDKILPLISRLIENNVSPSDALGILKGGSFDDPKSLSSVYGHYRTLMIENSTLDFPGLIAEALGILETRVGVQKQIHRIYPYVCVDEFQDTNLCQYKILSCLVNPATRNLFVVADDDQIIYQWNGASPERLWALRTDFEMKLLQLPENYRCPPIVVEIANRLIAHNFGRPPEKGKLTAHKTAPDHKVLTVHEFDDFEMEAKWVAKDIASRQPEERSKCVVLSRTKKLLERVICALDEAGITGYLAIRKSEFESAPIQWLHSILRLANSRSNREHLRRVCKAFYSLEGIDLNIKDIISHASTLDGDYLRSWSRAALDRNELTPSTQNLITNSLSALSERLDYWKFQKDAFAWLNDLPDVTHGIEGSFDEYEEEKCTWHDLVNEITAQYGKNEVTLHLLLQELDLRSKAPTPPENAIPCFTIHASKGMEFDHVYLVGMVEDQLPSWAAIRKGDNSRNMQEERRNCFVAITRAQETLSLTYSSRVQGWEKKPSRFLFEMGILTV